MALGGLSFRPRRGTASPVDVDGVVVLTGEIEWVASGVREDVDALARAVGPAIADRAGENALLLRFGNAVGTFRVAGHGYLEVRCDKWSEATFDAMLSDLSRIPGALPFLTTATAGLAHERAPNDRDDVQLHAFLYVRHIVLSTSSADALVPTLSSLLRDPHRRFDSEREQVPRHDARSVDARNLARSASGAGAFVEAPPSLRTTSLSTSPLILWAAASPSESLCPARGTASTPPRTASSAHFSTRSPRSSTVSRRAHDRSPRPLSGSGWPTTARACGRPSRRSSVTACGATSAG